MTTRRATILAALLLAAAIAGCNRFTRQRYETVYVGQPAWDVRRVLGSPTTRERESWVYVHDSLPYYQAIVRFSDGKVTGKSWSYDRPTSQPVSK